MQPTESGPKHPWDDAADQLLGRLPPAPDNLIEGYVTWAPWIAMVFGALGLLSSLAAYGSLAVSVFNPYGYLLSGFAIYALLGSCASAAQLVGGYLMRQIRLTGWWLVAIGLALSAAVEILTFSLLALVITLGVVYIHLQAKPRYS
jgi:hypothetical protein